MYGESGRFLEHQMDVNVAMEPSGGEAEAGGGVGGGVGGGGERAGRLRGLLLSVVGLLSCFGLMAYEHQVRHAAAFGLLGMLVAALGLLRAFGMITRAQPEQRPWLVEIFAAKEGEASWAAPTRTVPVALTLLGVGGAIVGADKLFFVIVAALAVLLMSAIRRPALLVFVAASAVMLPNLGGYGLWDPWETHYGEVSREILSRNDWISLWWAQDRWFWSKPILIFWSEALTWSALGLEYRPNLPLHHVEWALRLPIFTMAMGALLAVYACLSRIFSPRAGVLGALALVTMPHFFFLSHQAITDMPFVANMTIATCLLLMAFATDSDREAEVVRIGPYALSARELVVGLLLLLVLPQIGYLASRNITMVESFKFAWHGDQFLSGSAGNDGVPGNTAVYRAEPSIKGFAAQPIMQALYWLVGLSLVVWSLRRERRVQTLLMVAFYVFCALAFMGKGIPGFALPGVVALGALGVSGRWSLLLEGRLRVGLGIVIIAITGMPWFVAMYMRHGAAFTDRILVHDHLNRLAAGVHGDNGSIQYFIEQLGVGLFPWVALIPAALALLSLGRAHAAEETPVERTQRETVETTALWFTAVFVLFSAMVTKFHHYIMPAVPPLALLTGVLLDRMLPTTSPDAKAQDRVVALASGLCAPIALLLGVGGLMGDVRGVIPKNVATAARADWILLHGLPLAGSLVLIAIGLSLAAISVRQARRASVPASSGTDGFTVAVLAGVMICAFVGRDLSWNAGGKPVGYERLIHLFVYNYGRPWPDQFDYRPVLTGFAVVAVVSALVAAFRFLRATGVYMLLGTALAFSVWCLDVYMIDLTPHWGQRELFDRYFAERKSPSAPIVAWQMNWKGENFYTGNRVAVFVQLDNKELKPWLEKHKGEQAFFVLEHGRLANFNRLMPGGKSTSLTTKHENNKFILVTADL